MSDAFVEIRDYTIDPAWFAAYKVWASEEAAPWLKANLPVIDFWMDADKDAEVSGSDPVVSRHGQANVCWILSWANHPNADSYLQMNARFMKTA